MIRGYEVWNSNLQKGMGFRKIGEKEVFTFQNMRNNYYEILEDTTERFAQKVAFCDNWNREYTFCTFLQMVDDFAEYLQKVMRVKRKSHVGLLLHNSIEFCTAFYAISKIGAVAVPFPSKYREPEIRALIEKADLDFLLCAEEFKAWVDDYEEKGICTVYSIDEEHGFGFRHLEIPEGSQGNSKGQLTDEVIIMFTSGTTSASKGVVLKNYNIIHATMIYQRLCEVTAEDKTIIPVPIYHITGLIALLGLFVYTGGTVYLYRRYDARRVLECILRNNITFMHGSPTVFGMLLDYQSEFPKLPSLKTMLCGSSYLPAEKMKKIHGWLPTMKLMTVFGMTETASPGTLFPYDTPTSIYSESSGKPIPGVDLKIVDEQGNELPPGEVGSVLIKGANILEYYYKTETSLLSADGWLDTGDMGYYNQDAYVFFVDRKKDMINRGGEKIWCTDVEDELISMPQIKDAAVVGIPDDTYGEVAAAVIVPEKGQILTFEEITDYLKTRLARYKLPEKVLFVNEVPKTPGLKVNKKYIRTMFDEEGIC